MDVHAGLDKLHHCAQIDIIELRFYISLSKSLQCEIIPSELHVSQSTSSQNYFVVQATNGNEVTSLMCEYLTIYEVHMSPALS